MIKAQQWHKCLSFNRWVGLPIISLCSLGSTTSAAYTVWLSKADECYGAGKQTITEAVYNYFVLLISLICKRKTLFLMKLFIFISAFDFISGIYAFWMKFKINKLLKSCQMKDLEVSFIACVVVLLLSEEGKWLADWSVVRSQTSHRHLCLMGKCLCVHASHWHVTAEPHGRHI